MVDVNQGITRTAILVAVVMALSTACFTAIAHAAESSVVPLYDGSARDALGVSETRVILEQTGETLVFNVSEPTLELFRPAPGSATGAAVIIAPGGGFVALAYDQGGTAIARRLAEHGITALVLKYRTIESSGDAMQLPPVHQAEMDALMARVETGEPVEVPEFAGEAKAVEDGMRAMEIVRQHSADWDIDRDRIGMLGFSSGAFIAARLATGDEASRPDFVGLIYGGLRSPVPADASPAFIAAAADDELLATDSVHTFTAWRSAGAPAELHMYESGGHGFDLRPNGTTSDEWFNHFLGWMAARRLLEP